MKRCEDDCFGGRVSLALLERREDEERKGSQLLGVHPRWIAGELEQSFTVKEHSSVNLIMDTGCALDGRF